MNESLDDLDDEVDDDIEDVDIDVDGDGDDDVDIDTDGDDDANVEIELDADEEPSEAAEYELEADSDSDNDITSRIDALESKMDKILDALNELKYDDDDELYPDDDEDTDEDDDGQINDNISSAAAFIRFSWELPDVAEADGRTGCCQNKADFAAPLCTFRFHNISSPFPLPLSGAVGIAPIIIQILIDSNYFFNRW